MTKSVFERTKYAIAFIFALLNKAMAAEVCDARMFNGNTVAWFKKMY